MIYLTLILVPNKIDLDSSHEISKNDIQTYIKEASGLILCKIF
jgi:GTPase SAR1 family protein